MHRLIKEKNIFHMKKILYDLGMSSDKGHFERYWTNISSKNGDGNRKVWKKSILRKELSGFNTTPLEDYDLQDERNPRYVEQDEMELKIPDEDYCPTCGATITASDVKYCPECCEELDEEEYENSF